MKSREINQLVIARCEFFAKRVEHYAKQMNLDNREVLEHLQHIAATRGEGAITASIDVMVPARLHSSNMPQ